MESNTSKRLIGASILTAVLVFFGLVIPLTLGLGTESIFEEGVGDIIDFYAQFYWGLIIIWGVLISFIFLRKNNKYKDTIGFYGKADIEPLNKMTGFQKTLLSFILISPIFLLANFLKLGGFTGLRVLPQQFTPAQSLLFSSLLIPISENILFGAILSLVILTLTIIALKYKVNPSEYLIYKYFFTALVGSIFAFLWHKNAYPNSELALTVVVLFWAVGTIILVATNFFITFLAMHIANNFFLDAQRIYSSDFIFSLVIGFIVALCFLYYFLYRGNLFGGGKKTKGVLE